MTEYKKLDPHVKDVWVAALRSGDFVQGYKQLGKCDPSSQVSFCCLGVLAVCTPEVSKPYWKEGTLCVKDDDLRGKFDEISILPMWLENIYGLDEDAQTYLIEMNDSGRSFDDIATWIDNNLGGGWGHNPNGHDWPQPQPPPYDADDEDKTMTGVTA